MKRNIIKRFLDFTAKWEKIGFDNFYEIGNDISNEDNILHCKKCKSLLPIFKFIVLSRCYKGEIFYVKCRKCKHVNAIERW